MSKNRFKVFGVLGIILFLLIPVPSLVSLVFPGFFDPHDMHHLADIYEMYRAFVSGQFPPRLGPDFSFGYTYPLFNYYYLLPFYLGAFFYFIVGSLTVSFKLVLILCMLISYVGMYKFLGLHFNKLASISAAALFLYTPYRAVQIYVRGSIGEALALSILPWVLFFVGKYIKAKDNKYLALGAFIFFLFVISHNYFFALSIPIILFYSVLYIRGSNKSSGLLKGVFLIITLGLMSASYWIIPALMEKNLVRGDTPFVIADHFPFLKQLIIPSWGYGSSVWGPEDEISFQIGIINLSAILGSVILFLHQFYKKTKIQNGFIYIFTFVGFFMSFVLMNIRTLPVWKIIPFHDLIQFPWRLLNFTTFFSSIALAVVVSYFRPGLQKFIMIISLIAMFIVGNQYFHPNKYFLKTDQEYLELFFNNPGYSEDYLLLPLWVEKRPESRAEIFFKTDKAQILSEQKEGILNWRGTFQSSGTSKVTANVYYFPGWKVSVNGKDVKIDKPGNNGLLEFETASGYSEVEVGWGETKLRRFADILSVISLFVILIMYTFPKLVKIK